MPTRLPDKVKKPKWAKPRKPHGKTSARSFTGAEAAEITADKAEQSSKMSQKQPGREDTPESSGADEIIIPRTPERAGESQGDTTITLALRTPERLRAGPDLTPRLSPPLEPGVFMAVADLDGAPKPWSGRGTPKTETRGHN